jgi:hypothetical protein
MNVGAKLFCCTIGAAHGVIVQPLSLPRSAKVSSVHSGQRLNHTQPRSAESAFSVA